jgi:hypothetical protein
MNTKKTVLGAFLVAGLSACSANGAIVANYAFTGGNGNTSDIEVNSVASSFTSTGLTVSYNDPNYVTGDTTSIRASCNSMASANGTDYYSFTITPTSGNYLMLAGSSAMTFRYARSTAGTWTYSWDVRSSQDNYVSSLGSGSVATGGAWQNGSVNLSSSFNYLTTGITFRLYVWDGTETSNSRYGYFDDVVLNGSITPVPEPINVALGFFGVCAGGVALGRRFRRNRS